MISTRICSLPSAAWAAPASSTPANRSVALDHLAMRFPFLTGSCKPFCRFPGIVATRDDRTRITMLSLVLYSREYLHEGRGDRGGHRRPGARLVGREARPSGATV